MIRVLCTTESGESCTLEIDPQSLVEDLAALIEVELGIPMLEQVLVADDGAALRGNATLESQGVCAGASVRVIHSARAHDEGPARQEAEGEEPPLDAPPSQRPQQRGLEPGVAPTPGASEGGHAAAPNPQRRLPHAPGEARARIEQLFSRGPGQSPGRLPLHESDPEVQRRIYEAIYWENINENLESAYEFMPEFFVRVPMLFVNCEVNKVKVKAFIDSGAQRSIMNRRTAEQCGLMRLLDTRATGIMRGVGVRRTLGVVHMVVVNLGGLHVPFSLCVIEDDKMDFIIGLDQMKLHRMIIDLRDNCLRVADTQIPFLPDSEAPEFVTGDEVVDEEEAGQGEAKAAVASATSVAGAGHAPAPSSEIDVKREQAIAAVVAYTKLDREGAVALLEAAGWNADLAVALFLGE
ncbi:DNA-damage inducible protein DDI1-like protein [Trypanosoma conorhini]|uniref:DNA-damage inducible protein DDI1-like protein n=1 Tax=Trypanosoma conorhini TaxID=83891 RepID=A0A3R7MV22_9TRYP|nr:DNA-damage inducible protein DDI1-like protein [Trypanosoma conorhini]RNF11727.1 DNA-damage inducible protein DDI1-like protein [Trypanosoma conorhini]